MMHREAQALIALVTVTTLIAGCAGTGGGEDKPKKRTILATEYDDVTIGAEAAVDLSRQMGIYDDPAMTDYVREVGRRMVQYTVRRPFQYRFYIVDQAMPNAFALPGGHVYISRGLLALAKDEAELANVIGHEITHAAERHASAQQEMARRVNPFTMPIVRMSKLASYQRAHENDADRGGQRIAAAAGYDPFGLPNFLQRLGNLDRLRFGSRLPGYLDTHPGTIERVATTSQRAAQLEVGRSAPVEADEAGYLKRIEGIVIGPNPAGGVFRGNHFIHPGLGFQMRFPAGWITSNDQQNVGARSPQGGAVVFLSVEGKAADPKEFAEKFIARHERRFNLEILRNTPIVIGGIDSWRVAANGNVGGQRLVGQLTFIPYGGLMYRITAVAPRRGANAYVAEARNTVRSFRPLPEDARGGFEVMRLRTVRARSGETIPALMKRTGSGFRPGGIAVLNGLFVDHRFRGGEMVKIAAVEPYEPARGTQ
ncbi:MAG: M48 family metalloprotease [Myxococcales bacterium]|nr:M48 family metalloprotease [Myxococcales bacterium]